MSYGYLGSMRTRPGQRDAVVGLLLANTRTTTMPGCDLYVVATDDVDPDLIWISEVWASKEAHDASLTIPEVRATIAAAMPMLTGEFTSHETTVHGGVGIG